MSDRGRAKAPALAPSTHKLRSVIDRAHAAHQRASLPVTPLRGASARSLAYPFGFVSGGEGIALVEVRPGGARLANQIRRRTQRQ
jgi:hypothetical protein